MKLDTGFTFDPADIRTAGEAARAAEGRGFDGLWLGEVSRDPFLPLVLAAAATERVELGTGVAIAFARSPMTLAQTAHDLQTYAGGRFTLGLGSQIKAHVTRRFSMPWSHPARRMREYVLALRAIWASWNDGAPLRFEGEFYRHTLMTPNFNPGPTGHGPPRVVLAGVNEQMTTVAGEVADGFVAHAFTTEPYVREVTIPALERGLALAGRTREDVELKVGLFLVTGRDDAELAAARDAARSQIAFYASTPAYRPVLELHGWGPLQEELQGLTRRGEWDAMGRCVDDDVVDAFAVVALEGELEAAIAGRWGGLADRLGVSDRVDPRSLRARR
ncbi:MAG: TIGR03617 family F420-dependent LLM class oxidoreductase [Acidimicrobiia bacterium]